MVTFLKYIFWISWLSSFAIGTDLELRTEFSKDNFYVGEQLLCNFVLYARDSGALEVEVAKFPEFRGYWKENLVLRQGPIPLTPAPKRPGWNMTLVGSYLIVPMVGSQERAIEQMKLVVRPAQFGETDTSKDTVLMSVGEPSGIKNLPVLSTKEAPHFTGAVGNFSLLIENSQLSFQKDEPTVLRLTLQGEGNFPELNDLPLPLPPYVEMLSKRASVIGTGQYTSKTFEWTLAIHSRESFTLTPTPFIFFNPKLQKYQRINTPGISFAFVPSQSADNESELLRFEPFATKWAAYRPLSKSGIFLAAHLLLLIFFCLLTLGRIVYLERKRILGSLRYQRKLRWKATISECKAGHLETFLRSADELAFELLLDRAKLPHSLTKSQALRMAQSKVDESFLNHAKALFNAYESYLFSPMKPQVDASTLLKHLSDLMP